MKNVKRWMNTNKGIWINLWSQIIKFGIKLRVRTLDIVKIKMMLRIEEVNTIPIRITMTMKDTRRKMDKLFKILSLIKFQVTRLTWLVKSKIMIMIGTERRIDNNGMNDQKIMVDCCLIIIWDLLMHNYLLCYDLCYLWFLNSKILVYIC